MNIEKVLVVDDSKVAHLTLRKLLTERGIEVDWVGSGEDSLSYLKDNKPHLIFMDVMMPGMDGFETTSAIKTEHAVGAPPIVMCSANTSSEDKENAEKLGAIDFLAKPYTAEELDVVLNKVRSLDAAAAPASAPAAVAPAVDAPVAAAAGNGSVHQTEQAAWATADKVAREVAGDIARSVAESAAQKAAEAAGRKAAQAATSAAKAAAEKAVQAAASDINRSVTDGVMKSVNTLLMQKLAEQKVDMPDLGKLRGEVLRELDQRIEQQVEKAVVDALESDAFKKQLATIVQQKALPTVEATARKAAQEASVEAARETLDAQPKGNGLAIAALVVGVLALAAAAVQFAL